MPAVTGRVTGRLVFEPVEMRINFIGSITVITFSVFMDMEEYTHIIANFISLNLHLHGFVVEFWPAGGPLGFTMLARVIELCRWHVGLWFEFRG